MNNIAVLKPGDEIRIVAPSNSWRAKDAGRYLRGKRRLEQAGFKVSFASNVRKVERFQTASLADRVADLTAAYRDPNVKAILALDGGYSANTLLDRLDWQLVAANPKPLIGFSDVTVLVNALYAQTGQVQYLGPTLFRLGLQGGNEYTLERFLKVMGGGERGLQRSRFWSDLSDKSWRRTPAWQVVQVGSGEGVVVGGNLGSLYLLQGTPYMPRFDQPTILAVEDDDEPGAGSAREFGRRLESLLQQSGLRQNLRGVLIGRFQPASKVTRPDVAYLVRKLDIAGVPVIAGMDFGHTIPMLTLPIGGRIAITAEGNRATVTLASATTVAKEQP